MKPLVSVGIPTYNNSKMLRQAIRSVLQQTVGDFEIIVVDDCSPDDTEAVVKSFGDSRIRYIRNEVNLRPPRSWNVSIREAKGEFFALLPQDDLWFPDFLEKMIGLLRKEQDIGYAQCAFCSVDSNLNFVAIRQMSSLQLKLAGEEAVFWQMKHLLCNPAAILFRTEVMRKMGLWREDYWDDWAFIVRTGYRYGFAYTSESLACVREHSNNLCRVLRGEGRDGLLDSINQQSDVFGEVLPVSPRMLAFRSRLTRSLSYSCLFHSVRAVGRGAWEDAFFHFTRARRLNPAIPFDFRIILPIAQGCVRQFRMLKQTKNLRKHITGLDRS